MSGGGFTLTNSARMPKLVPEACMDSKCLYVPSQQHNRESPWARSTKVPKTKTTMKLHWLLQCQGCSRASLRGGHPQRDLPKGSPVELMLSNSSCCPLLLQCLSQPYLGGQLVAPLGAPGLAAIPDSWPPPAPPARPGGGSHVRKQFPHAKELVPSRHALLKPHQPSY